jgi:hypothetical protein
MISNYSIFINKYPAFFLNSQSFIVTGRLTVKTWETAHNDGVAKVTPSLIVLGTLGDVPRRLWEDGVWEDHEMWHFRGFQS